MSSPAPLLTAQEAKLYDRQLRVWGAEAQARMRGASVLIAGALGGFAVEIAKNLILAGVGKITLHDRTPVQPAHLASSFALRSTDIGRPRDASSAPRLQELNPNVAVAVTAADEAPLSLAAAPAAFWQRFDVIVLIGTPLRVAVVADAHARAAGKDVGVFYGGMFGEGGFWMQDLGEFTYLASVKTVKAEVKERIPTTIAYPPIAGLLEGLVRAHGQGEAVSSAVAAAIFAHPSAAAAASDVGSDEGGAGAGAGTGSWEATACSALASAAAPWSSSLRGALRHDRPRALTLCHLLAAAAAANDDDLTAAAEGAAAAKAAGEAVEAALRRRNVETVSDAAVVGGLVAQEVLKGLARASEPLVNTAVYDGEANKVIVFKLGE